MTNSKHPVNGPDDLKGLKMRTMENPVHIQAYKAFGIIPTPMAFTEVFTALQQGTVDGQENPINNIAANNIQEVQDVMSMSGHQLNSNLVVINEATWQSLTPEQQASLQGAVTAAMEQVPACVEEFESTTLEEWRANDVIEIVEDVDREAFRTKAEPYLRENFSEEQVPVLEAIRSVAE
jgi:TRAP-type C4-dicarboxylate transport system substrate-binding protein